MGILSSAKRLPAMVLRRLPPSARNEAVAVANGFVEEVAYRKLAERGFRPAGIIDVGAYHGDWTRMARSVFHDTPALMVEAQEGKKPYLDAVCASLPKVSYASTLLGSQPGQQATFYEMETGSSLLPEQSNVPRTERTLTMRTLDEVAGEALAGLEPLFLKLDVQGAELQVLAGGAATLQRCEVVQLEVALLPYNRGAPTMLEVMSFMDARGFVPFDIAGFIRPNGRDLVQVDLMFARRDSALRPDYFNY